MPSGPDDPPPAVHGIVPLSFVGIIAALGPGIYNASSITLLHLSTKRFLYEYTDEASILYGTMSLTSFMSGFIIRLVGTFPSLVLGSISYSVWMAHRAFEWSVWVDVTLCVFQGLTAAIFWCVVISSLHDLSNDNNRGFIFAFFMAIANTGTVFGYFLVTGFVWWSLDVEAEGIYGHYDDYKWMVSLVLHLISLCGPFLVCRLFTPALARCEKDMDMDSEPLYVLELRYLKQLISLLFNRSLWMSYALYWYSNMFYSIDEVVVVKFFNQRSFPVVMSLYWVAQILGGGLVRVFLDSTRNKKERTWRGLLFFTVVWIVSCLAIGLGSIKTCGNRVFGDSEFRDYSYLNGGVNKHMAWFPNVCKDYPGMDSCVGGCDFLENCRVTGRFESSVSEMEDAGTNYICDSSFPRCATELEASPCKLDVVNSEVRVCSLALYAKLELEIYRFETRNAEVFCEGVDKSNETGYLPMRNTAELQWQDPRDPSNWPLDYEPFFVRGYIPDRRLSEEQLARVCESLLVGVCEWSEAYAKCITVEGGQDILDTIDPTYPCLKLNLNFLRSSIPVILALISRAFMGGVLQVYIMWEAGSYHIESFQQGLCWTSIFKSMQAFGASHIVEKNNFLTQESIGLVAIILCWFKFFLFQDGYSLIKNSSNSGSAQISDPVSEVESIDWT